MKDKQVIIYKRDTNEVGVVYPVQSQTEQIDNLIARCVLPGVPFKVINPEQLPGDFEYYGAWEWGDNAEIKINIPKAKEIQKNKFRQARKPILEKLDLEYMRADEQSNVALKQQIAAKKQALRDITNTSLPDDLEGIKNTWPSILNS